MNKCRHAMLFQLVTARCKLLQMHCKSTMHKSVDPSDVLGGGNVSSINCCGITVGREPLYRIYRGYRVHRAPDIPVIQNQKN